MIERLFDIVAERAAADPNAEMLAAKENGQWKTYSCKTVWETAQKLCGGLLTLGIKNQTLEPEAQEKIAIISFNRPEWMMVDLGVQMTGAVLTPIYPTISPTELAHIFKEAEVKIVFISNAELYDRFKDAFAEVPSLQHVFSFDKTENVPSWTTLIEKNAPVDQSVIDRIKYETLATIIYTSGTTGDPKGVMLSHKNIVSNVHDSMPAFTFAQKGSRALSFLPLNHIFERMVTYIYIQAGVAVYYAESMDTIGANLKEVKPFVFTVVPRLLEKVYERIMATGIELKGIKRALFFWALELGKKFDNVNHGSAWYRFQLAIANKLVFNKWREALGGNVRAVVNGSAALQDRLIRIFTAAHVVVMEGYGLTETSPVISVNRYESENRRVGTVGPLIDNVEVKIAEDGEILAKGPNIMMGYYKKPELTAEAMKDGWFHTGDIGEWQEGRFLKITDRKKEIFKTSGGKYVAPQMIENKLRESPFIEQMMVIGNGRKFVSALIVPNFGQVKKTLHISESDNNKVIKMPEVIALIQKQLDKYNPLFSHPEQVKKFELLPHEWTIDTGELTPSLKIKRKAVEQKYSKIVEGMYADGQVQG